MELLNINQLTAKKELNILRTKGVFKMKQHIISEQLNELINKGLEEINNNPFIPESTPVFGKSLTKKFMREKLKKLLSVKKR